MATTRQTDGEGFSFTTETALAADAARVWAHATSFDGVNRELAPFAHMTTPPSVQTIDENTVVLGQRLLRSWILAFGVMPIDYDDVVIVELEVGRRFLERSTMLTQRVWEHERTVEPAPGGCVLRDRIRFEPRIPALGYAQKPIFKMVFRNRHRQLVKIFGSPATEPRR